MPRAPIGHSALLALAALAALALAGCLSPGAYNLSVNAPGLAGPAATGSPTVAVTVPGPGATPQAPPPSTRPAVEAPDQSQESVSSFQQVGQGTRIAQTFTTTRSASLVAVSLRLKAGVGSGPVAVIVRSVDANQHPAETLGGGTVTMAGLDDTGASWSRVVLAPPVAATAGIPYALTLTCTGSDLVYVGLGNDNSYPNGHGLTGLTDGSTFWNKLGQDLAFRTYLAR